MCDDLLFKLQKRRKSATIDDVVDEALTILNQNLGIYGKSLADHATMPKPDPTKLRNTNHEIDFERFGTKLLGFN